MFWRRAYRDAAQTGICKSLILRSRPALPPNAHPHNDFLQERGNLMSSDFEDECRQGCLHSLFCLVLRILRNLHLVSKKFYRKHCSCDLKLVAISFNHDSASLNADAMNVRKNFTQGIAAPEWTVGKTLAT